jgi:mono/diheme cytochrome c family protein
VNQSINGGRGVIPRFKPAIVFLILFTAFTVAVADRLVRTTNINYSASAAPDAASLFNSQCAQCHGRDGRAKTKRGRQTHSRDITSAEWQNDVSDERIFNSISRGKGKMPAFKKLSDTQVDSLVTYVRRLKK